MPAKRANQMSSYLITLHCHITGHFANDRILLSVGFTVSKRSHTTVTYRCIVRTIPVYVLAHWWLVAPGTIARLAQSHVLKTASSQSCTFTPVVGSKVCVVDTLLPLFWMNAPYPRRKNDKWCRGTFTFSGIWHLPCGQVHASALPCRPPSKLLQLVKMPRDWWKFICMMIGCRLFRWEQSNFWIHSHVIIWQHLLRLHERA